MCQVFLLARMSVHESKCHYERCKEMSNHHPMGQLTAPTACLSVQLMTLRHHLCQHRSNRQASQSCLPMVTGTSVSPVSRLELFRGYVLSALTPSGIFEIVL